MIKKIPTYTLFLTLIVLGLCVLGMSVRVFIKNEPFKGGCASNNPMLKNEIGECSVCGKTPEEDCKMPEIDGYQTAEQLRSENYEGPIIGMTNRRWQDEIDDVIRCGMTSCTTKPLDAEELYNLILDLV